MKGNTHKTAQPCLSNLLLLLDTHIPVQISKRRQHHPLSALKLPLTEIEIGLRPQKVSRLFGRPSPNTGNITVDGVKKRHEWNKVGEEEMDWGVPEEDECGD